MKPQTTGAPAAAVPPPNPCEGKKSINTELWHACAGPLVSLPPVGSLVVYFPQGHSEQVAASMQKDADAHIPNYPSLPSKLICLLHNVTLHADAETDEVYAQMTLQPVNTYDKEALLASDLALRTNKPQTDFFCKTLTASDTSTHGAAHAAANHSPFTVFYNPRASPSEFVIPLAKYNKAIYSNQISLGMRFRMLFETEESGTRRYMGTITGISDLDSVRWKNSPWRNLQVGWDESAAGERRNKVSIWEIEPIAAPFFIYPPPMLRSKRPRQPGMPDDDSSDIENLFKRTLPWLGEDICMKDSQSQNAAIPGLNLVRWMNMPQNSAFSNSAFSNSNMQSDYLRTLASPVLQNLASADLSRQLGLQAQLLQQNNIQFTAPKPPSQSHQLEQIPKLPITANQLSNVNHTPQQIQDINQQQQRQQLVNQTLHMNQTQTQVLPQNNVVARQPYMGTTAQMDYLDTSSSVTSVCISQTDGSLQQNMLPSFNQHAMLFRDLGQEGEVLAPDPRLFGVSIDGPLGIPLTPDVPLAKSIPDDEKAYENHLPTNMVSNYPGVKESQQELSSSIVSQSFGVPDMAFNSIDSTINDGSFLNQNSWVPSNPPFQRLRTYTKVYKRGAVGRSIDITRYSGYDELKQDLARMFSIEGQLEDRQRIGWKLVYVDHENDVLLVGDDPWE
ncbi:Auxin response factor 19 [Acorus gramineus]|uniref:Auxin response factor 19 n=1 Tax=Acorus gramineus TaxID=55184 RepID=A0AAV9BGT9_ACOGR|nr:Auxin response factor 19 [Acorus gramineus]